MVHCLKHHEEQAQKPVLGCVWKTGAWKLLPFLLIYSIGFATVFPAIPTLVANGFASQAAGRPMHCETYAQADQPTVCREARVQAVNWNAWSSFVSSSVLSCVFAPAVGRWSDKYGRKPFMLLGVSLALAPMAMLLLHIWGWAPIQWYYPTSALNGAVSSFSMALMSVADLLHQVHRAAAVGYLSACFSIGIIVGPLLGGFLETDMAVYVCLGMYCVTLAYVLLVVDETAPLVLAKRKAKADRHRHGREGQSSNADGSTTTTNDGNDVEQPLLQNCHLTDGEPLETPLDLDPIPNLLPHVHEPTMLSLPARITRPDGVNSCASSPKKSQAILRAHKSWTDMSPEGVTSEDFSFTKPATQPSRFGATQSQEQQQAGARKLERTASRGLVWGHIDDMLIGMRVIRHSPWFQKLVIIWIVVSMTFEGAQDLLMQYLGMQLQFDVPDTAHILFIVALCGLTIKLGALSTMVKYMGEQGVLILGLVAYMAQDILLAVANTKLMAQLAITVGSLSCVCWPVSVALQTKHAAPEEMGAVQGALQGISSLATGIGPVGFAALFSAFSLPERSGLPYFPQVVWYLAAALSLLAILLTATLHWNEPDRQPKQNDAARAQHAAEESADVHPLAGEAA